jgi:hypothetical protein
VDIREQQGATMKATALRFAAIAGLAGALALTAAAAAAFASIRTEGAAKAQISQYCAPQQEEPWDTQAHRVYCGNERG